MAKEKSEVEAAAVELKEIFAKIEVENYSVEELGRSKELREPFTEELWKLFAETQRRYDECGKSGRYASRFAIQKDLMEKLHEKIQSDEMYSHVLKILILDPQRNGPLHFAVRHYDRELVEYLLQKGCHPDGKNKISTPLNLAVQSGCEEIVKLLMDKKANINTCDEHGNTPLFYALSKGEYSIACTLLAHGAQFTLSQKAEKQIREDSLAQLTQRLIIKGVGFRRPTRKYTYTSDRNEKLLETLASQPQQCVAIQQWFLSKHQQIVADPETTKQTLDDIVDVWDRLDLDLARALSLHSQADQNLVKKIFEKIPSANHELMAFSILNSNRPYDIRQGAARVGLRTVKDLTILRRVVSEYQPLLRNEQIKLLLDDEKTSTETLERLLSLNLYFDILSKFITHGHASEKIWESLLLDGVFAQYLGEDDVAAIAVRTKNIKTLQKVMEHPKANVLELIEMKPREACQAISQTTNVGLINRLCQIGRNENQLERLKQSLGGDIGWFTRCFLESQDQLKKILDPIRSCPAVTQYVKEVDGLINSYVTKSRSQIAFDAFCRGVQEKTTQALLRLGDHYNSSSHLFFTFMFGVMGLISLLTVVVPLSYTLFAKEGFKGFTNTFFRPYADEKLKQDNALKQISHDFEVSQPLASASR